MVGHWPYNSRQIEEAVGISSQEFPICDYFSMCIHYLSDYLKVLLMVFSFTTTVNLVQKRDKEEYGFSDILATGLMVNGTVSRDFLLFVPSNHLPPGP